MKKGLGLFAFTLLLSGTAIAASSTLFLRASIRESFRIEVVSGTPKLLSNIGVGQVKPTLKVERSGDLMRVTIIHP